jgi:hypothetical protein
MPAVQHGSVPQIHTLVIICGGTILRGGCLHSDMLPWPHVCHLESAQVLEYKILIDVLVVSRLPIPIVHRLSCHLSFFTLTTY